jgi:3-methyl-2-oxobutanoate hydroxymethyltransferase
MAILSINDFKTRKEESTPISVITSYDFPMSRIINKTEIDAILVGDSLGMVVAGYSSTIPVTIDQMIYHGEIVRRGAPDKFIIVDLPFMSYHVSVPDTLLNAGRIMKETECNAIKLEGGKDFVPQVEALTRASIPVMGHLGLTPQSVHKLGGYSVQGRDEDKARTMLEDARALEDAGAFALVLEMVPENLAKTITEELSIPIIGIGAGRYTDGQVLVVNDLLGFDERFNPKFMNKNANVHDAALEGIEKYDKDVKIRSFPEEKNVFK